MVNVADGNGPRRIRTGHGRNRGNTDDGNIPQTTGSYRRTARNRGYGK